ncbi:MAG: cobalamin-dependent protein [Deferrisomatales bacterium]
MNITELARSLEDLKDAETLNLTREVLAEGHPPKEVLLRGLCAGMDRVGERYARREYFVPDMLRASQIFNQALAILEPLLARDPAEPFARGAIGVVKGNTQDNGKNIVRILLRANGAEVEDLGKSVPAEKFVDAARGGADFVGISVMTSGGVGQARKVVEALAAEGLRHRVKVLVGGAAVNERTAADLVGADGYAADAAAAVALVRRWFAGEGADHV